MEPLFFWKILEGQGPYSKEIKLNKQGEFYSNIQETKKCSLRCELQSILDPYIMIHAGTFFCSEGGQGQLLVETIPANMNVLANFIEDQILNSPYRPSHDDNWI